MRCAWSIFVLFFHAPCSIFSTDFEARFWTSNMVLCTSAEIIIPSYEQWHHTARRHKREHRRHLVEDEVLLLASRLLHDHSLRRNSPSDRILWDFRRHVMTVVIQKTRMWRYVIKYCWFSCRYNRKSKRRDAFRMKYYALVVETLDGFPSLAVDFRQGPTLLFLYSWNVLRHLLWRSCQMQYVVQCMPCLPYNLFILLFTSRFNKGNVSVPPFWFSLYVTVPRSFKFPPPDVSVNVASICFIWSFCHGLYLPLWDTPHFLLFFFVIDSCSAREHLNYALLIFVHSLLLQGIIDIQRLSTTPFSLVLHKEYFDCPQRESHAAHYIKKMGEGGESGLLYSVVLQLWRPCVRIVTKIPVVLQLWRPASTPLCG